MHCSVLGFFFKSVYPYYSKWPAQGPPSQQQLFQINICKILLTISIRNPIPLAPCCYWHIEIQSSEAVNSFATHPYTHTHTCHMVKNQQSISIQNFRGEKLWLDLELKLMLLLLLPPTNDGSPDKRSHKGSRMWQQMFPPHNEQDATQNDQVTVHSGPGPVVCMIIAPIYNQVGRQTHQVLILLPKNSLARAG